MSTVAIVLIVLGVLLLLGIIGLIVGICYCRKNKKCCFAPKSDKPKPPKKTSKKKDDPSKKYEFTPSKKDDSLHQQDTSVKKASLAQPEPLFVDNKTTYEVTRDEML